MAKELASWPFKPVPHNPEAHVISNVGMFANCRRDAFCRCRKCRPPLKPSGEIKTLAAGAETR